MHIVCSIIRAKCKVIVVKNQQGLDSARRLLRIQLITTAMAAGVGLVVSGAQMALSCVLGGLVSALPSACFARILFRYQGARSARLIVNSFYKGEAIKIGLSIALFALVFAFANIIPWAFFTVYLVVQLLLWFAPLIFVHKQHRPERD